MIIRFEKIGCWTFVNLPNQYRGPVKRADGEQAKVQRREKGVGERAGFPEDAPREASVAFGGRPR